MGVPVTCDSDDLEALLNAAALTVQFEQLIVGYRNDPAVMRLRGKFETASDRIRRQRGDAIRPPDNPFLGQMPTEEEARTMQLIEKVGMVRLPYPGMNILREKGYVVHGQYNAIIQWGDKSTDNEVAPYQVAKLTARGMRWLEENINEQGTPRTGSLMLLQNPGS